MIMFLLIKMSSKFKMIKKKIHFLVIINISKNLNIYKLKPAQKIIWMIMKLMSSKKKLL